MKKRIFKTVTLFLAVALIGLSSCKKEPEKTLDDVCYASLMSVNYFEGEDGMKPLGTVQEGPAEIDVKSGAMISLRTQTDDFGSYDNDDEISKVLLEIKNDDGVTRSVDLIDEDDLATKLGSHERYFMAEKSCDITVTFYSKNGKTSTKKLRVNVTDAKDTYINGAGIGNYSQTGYFSFFAPYIKRSSETNNYVNYNYYTGNQSSIDLERPYSLCAALAAKSEGNSVTLMSADYCNDKNMMPHNSEFGFNGMEMELLNIPDYTGEWWGNDFSDFENYLVTKNLSTNAQLDAMTFNNPSKTLTVQDNQFFKFRTLSGKKGIAVAKQNTTTSNYSNILFVIQR